MIRLIFIFWVLKEIENHKEQNLEGEMFWDSLVLSFHHSENLQKLQVNITLTLRITTNLVCFCTLFFTFVYSYFRKIGFGCFNPNKKKSSNGINISIL